MDKLDLPNDEELRRKERLRSDALYRLTEHYKKWDRVEQSQAHKFKSNVASIKPIFDCLGMIGFSATVFGLAVASHLSQAADEFCERPLIASVLLLAALGLATGALAFSPVAHYALMRFAGARKSSLAPFPPRVAGQPRTGVAMAGVAVVVTYACVFALAFAIAQQIVSRAPTVVCVARPLPV